MRLPRNVQQSCVVLWSWQQVFLGLCVLVCRGRSLGCVEGEETSVRCVSLWTGHSRWNSEKAVMELHSSEARSGAQFLLAELGTAAADLTGVSLFMTLRTSWPVLYLKVEHDKLIIQHVSAQPSGNFFSPQEEWQAVNLLPNSSCVHTYWTTFLGIYHQDQISDHEWSLWRHQIFHHDIFLLSFWGDGYEHVCLPEYVK